MGKNTGMEILKIHDIEALGMEREQVTRLSSPSVAIGQQMYLRVGLRYIYLV